MFRVVRESEYLDERQHCFLLQTAGGDPRYLTVETRQELLRIDSSWNTAIITSVVKLGVSIVLLLSCVKTLTNCLTRMKNINRDVFICF